MTPDEMKALIEKTRRIDGMWSKEQIAAHANRLADALEAALERDADAPTPPLPDEQLDAVIDRLGTAPREQRNGQGVITAAFWSDLAVLIGEVRRLRFATVTAEQDRNLAWRAMDTARAEKGDAIREAERLRAENVALAGELAEMYSHFAIQESRLRALSSHPDEETDSARRLLWIIADRNIDGITISDAELAAVPRLPGIIVESDPVRGISVIRPAPEGSET